MCSRLATGAFMAEPTMEYRMWQRGTEWHWQVMSEHRVVASGSANSSPAARAAAFKCCLERSDKDAKSS